MQKTKSAVLLIFSLSIIMLMLCFYKETSAEAKSALESALFSVVPVLLPFCFMASIISDVFYALPIKIAVIAAFLIGNVCGNPIGAILAQSLYKNGALDRKNASVLLAVSSASSPAFCICVIGSVLSSSMLGLYIYLSNLALNLMFVFLIFKKNNTVQISYTKQKTEEEYSLTELIVRATKRSAANMSALAVCMVFFSSVSSLISSLFNMNCILSSVLASFLEIGSAVLKCSFIPKKLALPIAAFSSSFFGLSVFIQVFSNAKELSKATFIIIRLASSVILFLLFLHISSVFY